jgi:hypothetical protein
MAIRKVSTSSLGVTRHSDASAGTTKIVDIPDAPIVASLTNLERSVSVAFTASPSGGIPTSYTVTSTPGSFTASGSSSPLIVTGLATGTSYTFKVQATNATGTGPESAASDSVTAVGSVWTFAQTIDTSQNYTVPNSVTAIAAFAFSGGAGGAGNQGGQGGRAAAAILNNPTPATTYFVTVGGSGQGDSSFGTIISSSGNGNGSSKTSVGYSGTPNAGVGSNISLADVPNAGPFPFGGAGGQGGGGAEYNGTWDVYNGAGGGQAGGSPYGGAGGGGGQYGAYYNPQPGGTGQAGGRPGGGGGGGGFGSAGDWTNASGNGGAGGAGRVIVWEKRLA